MTEPSGAHAADGPSTPQVAHTHVLRVTGSHAAVAAACAAVAAGGGALVDDALVHGGRDQRTVDLTVRAADERHAVALVRAVDDLPGLDVIADTDVVLALHDGGKLVVDAKTPVRDLTDLAMVYTPGVARVCTAIADDPARAYDLTIKRNSVAVVTDGSAVLGLGDIGPLAALPVMEGKAMLLKELAGVDAYPICLDERDPDRLVDVVTALAPGFGGVLLEDVSAPRCFEVEGKLRQRLRIPVFHDDQHGTAIVVLAALRNAARVVGKEVGPDLRVVVQGIGAAGVAITNLLLAAGVVDVVGVDVHGIVTPRRKEARDPIFRRLGRQTNPRGLEGSKEVAFDGADAVIGVSSGGTITPQHLDLMAPEPIVFAMANPVPEIDPALARGRAAVVATGRSDHPNQINNVLCFPGLFRGLLDARARDVNDAVKLAAAGAIAAMVPADEVGPERILPSALDPGVVRLVAGAVAAEAAAAGAARSPLPPSTAAL